MTIEYRLDRKRELRENLERLADEEAGLDQLAKDLEIYSKSQETEVRLRTKGLSLLEREDLAEAKEYVDNLRKQTEKATQERKEKWGKRTKFVAKVVGVTVALTSVGYGVSSTVKWYNQKQKVEQEVVQIDKLGKDLSERLVDAADTDCDGLVGIDEFHHFYRGATGKFFFNTNLESRYDVSFNFKEDTKSIAVLKLDYNTIQITMPPLFAEELIQKTSNRSCSITLE